MGAYGARPGKYNMSLPLEIWYKICKYLPDPTMADHIRLAQVCRGLRRVFLSDEAWAKFDAYNVQGQNTVYEYGGYQLNGIVAHFFNYLSKLPRPEQVTFFETQRFDGEYVSSTDLYSQLNALSLITLDYNFDSTCLQLIKLGVWKLWSSSHNVTPSLYADYLKGGRLIPTWALQDKQVCLFLIYIGCVDFVPSIFENDWDINLAVFIHSEDEHTNIAPHFWENQQFVLQVLSFIKGNQPAWQLCERLHQLGELPSTPEDIVVRAVALTGAPLEFASLESQSNRELVMAAVIKDGNALEFASEELRGDYNLVMAAVKQAGCAIKFASEALRSNCSIATAAVNQSASALQFVSDNLRGDRNFVMAAVQQSGHALEYANRLLYSDRELVMAAVTRDGATLGVASGSLRDDRELVMVAVRQYGCALKFASGALRSDRELVLAAATQNGAALEFASKDLRSDEEIILAVVCRDYRGLEYASESLRNERDFVFKAIKLNGDALLSTPKALYNDQELVLEALRSVTQLGFFLLVGQLRLNGDLELQEALVWEALRRNDLKHLGLCEDVLENRELVLRVVAQSGMALRYLPPQLQNDKQVVLAAVRTHKGALRFVSEELRRDPDIAEAASR